MLTKISTINIQKVSQNHMKHVRKRKLKKMANTKHKSLVWLEDEVELLSRATLDY